MDDPNPPESQRPELNPYLIAAGLLFRRLLWDLRIESWRSRRKLRRLMDRFRGEKAVILCNGPSLLKVDFAQLAGTFTFGLNKINLLFEQTSFRPSCIVAMNRHVIDQNADFYNATDIPLFLHSYALGRVGRRRQVCFLPSTSVQGFARDCSWSVFQGHTVTYVALQLAFHMGFRQVALVGCDHSFAATGPANAAVLAEGDDENHFHPGYFSAGMTWQLPDLVESEIAYLRARKIYEACGRSVVNATAGGRLEIFPRQDLGEFLAAAAGSA